MMCYCLNVHFQGQRVKPRQLVGFMRRHISHRVKAPNMHCIRSCVAPAAGMDALRKTRTSCTCRESNPEPKFLSQPTRSQATVRTEYPASNKVKTSLGKIFNVKFVY